MTTNLKPGYVRRNGAPYSNRAVVTEYWDLHTLPNKDGWLTVTTKVEDPVYFTRPYLDQLRLQETAQFWGVDAHPLLHEIAQKRCYP